MGFQIRSRNRTADHVNQCQGEHHVYHTAPTNCQMISTSLMGDVSSNSMVPRVFLGEVRMGTPKKTE